MTRLATYDTQGPSLSRTQMLDAYQGIPREALVEPSTGSMTAIRVRSGTPKAALLGEDPDASPVEHLERGGVRHKVEGVLAGATPQSRPVGRLAPRT